MSDFSVPRNREAALSEAGISVSSLPSEGVFDEVVKRLAATLDVDLAFIGKLTDEGMGKIETAALYFQGKPLPNMMYSTEGTPCSTVVGNDFSFIPEQLGQLYPGDGMVTDMRFQSYAGYPMFDSEGRALGLVAVLSQQPMTQGEFYENILKIYAIRVAAELEKQRAGEALRQSVAEKEEAEAGRAQLEEQLRQAQKMEAIGHLTGGIAHDFNNLLTGMIGYVSMALDYAQDNGDEKLERYMTRAKRSGDRARDLIQQMLTFSRGQKGEKHPLKLEPVLTEFSTLLESTVPSSIEFVTQLDDNLPPVMIDSVQIEQVLMNLCLNARDAMRSSGRLEINIRHRSTAGQCASCRQSLLGRFIELEVKDAGPGIAADVLERMFEPFFTTKEVGKGSGMGLAMVHGIVHEHAGHIQVDSLPGEGTSFRILLPAMQAGDTEKDLNGAEASGQLSREPSLRGRVLLVDDEPSVGEYMQDLLESWGLDVALFQNSPSALNAVKAGDEAFSFAIIDQTMAHLSGLELSRSLRQEGCDFPVVIYTGYSEEIDQDIAAREDIVALLEKPLDSRRLHALLREHLS